MYGESIEEKFDINILQTLTISDTKLNQLTEETRNDSHLQPLTSVIAAGWPESKHNVPANWLPYWNYRDELSVSNDIIFKGDKVVIPKCMQCEILCYIHSSHLGVQNAKGEQEMLCPGLGWLPRYKTLLQTATSTVLPAKQSKRTNDGT